MYENLFIELIANIIFVTIFSKTLFNYDILLIIRYLYISRIPTFSTNVRILSFTYVIHNNYFFTSGGHSKIRHCATLVFRLKAILKSITTDCFLFVFIYQQCDPTTYISWYLQHKLIFKHP